MDCETGDQVPWNVN